MMRRGFFGSSSIAARMREIWTSIDRSKAQKRSFSDDIHQGSRDIPRRHVGEPQQQRELVARQGAGFT